jgi:hypothetical protein
MASWASSSIFGSKLPEMAARETKDRQKTEEWPHRAARADRPLPRRIATTTSAGRPPPGRSTGQGLASTSWKESP